MLGGRVRYAGSTCLVCSFELAVSLDILFDLTCSVQAAACVGLERCWLPPALATYPFYLHDHNEHEQHEHEHGNVLWWTCFSRLHSHDDIDHDGKHDLCWKRWFASASELFIALIIESKISYLHSAPSSLSTPFLLLGYHLSMQNCHGPPCDDLHLRKGCFAKASLQEESRDMEQGKIMKMVPCLIWESRFSCFCATTICHLRLFYVWCSVL